LQSGKSHLLLQLLKFRAEIFEKEFKRVLYFLPHQPFEAEATTDYIDRLHAVCDIVEVYRQFPPSLQFPDENVLVTYSITIQINLNTNFL
jgi:hypothetical protein